MKRYSVRVLLLMFIIFFALSAAAAIPHKLGMPVVVRSETGERLEDGTYTIILRVMDAEDTVLYQEQQEVEVENGVANMALGDGIEVGGEDGAYTGGVPVSVFDSAGHTRYVQIEVEGYLPQTITEVESVAYAYVAEKADGVADKGVTTAALADGAITEDKLSTDLYQAIFEDAIDPARINASLATTEYVEKKLAAKKVLAAGQIDAKLGLTWASGNDIGTVIKGLDAGLTYLKEIHLKNEATTRDKADLAEAETREGADVAESSARLTADTALSADLDTEKATRLSSDVALEAEIVAEVLSRQTADSEITARIDGITTELDPVYLNATEDDMLSGTYTLIGSLRLFPEGEDPDTSTAGIEAYTALTDHTGRIETLEAGVEGLSDTLDTLDFSEIDGLIADAQVPSAFTRDSELEASLDALDFGDIDGEIADNQIPSGIARDSELTSAIANYLPLSGGSLTGSLTLYGHIGLETGYTVDGYDLSSTLSDLNNIAGTLDESKIDADIARDSEISSAVSSAVSSLSGSSITSGTVSAAYIDSGITRDGEVNSYVTSIPGSAITSGTVSASYIDSAMATDSEVSSSISSALSGYLPLSGEKTMTGNIYMAEGKTVDGTDISALSELVGDHETRIDELEGEKEDSAQLAQASLSMAAYPGACCRTYSVPSSYLLSSYNIASVSMSYFSDVGVYYDISFSTPMSSANYIVVATAQSTTAIIAVVSDKTANSFRVRTYSGSSAINNNFDLVVHAQ